MSGFDFRPIKPKPWTGRYARTPGETSALHVRHQGDESRVVIVWVTRGLRLESFAVDNPHAKSLASAIMEAKRAAGGDGGGSFQINEYGQVLVPATDAGGTRFLVGEVRGSLRFLNPLDEVTFTLGDDSGLNTGDRWLMPYVGIPYNLSARDQVYFWREDETGGEKVEPPRLDPRLVPALRRIRRRRAVRFIVNAEGIALTKQRKVGLLWGSNFGWEPVYVGRLNLREWFDKEE